jgi:dTDP-4-amino-4,6-dideoxygalactose transaminase
MGGIAAGWRALAANDHTAASSVRGLIAKKFGANDVLLTDSGTSALTLALRMLCRDRSNRLVALPAYGCYDIATAADGADVEVVLYDVIPHTLGPDVNSMQRVLSQQPAVVVLAHLYGVPVNLDVVLQLCESHATAVVEDAAQGHGAAYGGLPLGSFGTVAVLSFGRGKGVTGGAGGALLSTHQNGTEVIGNAAEAAGVPRRGIRQLIGATAQWVLGSPWMYGIPASLPFLHLGETIYREPDQPLKMTPTAVAVLARTWKVAETESMRRKAAAAVLLEHVRASQMADPVDPPPGCEPGYLRLPIIVREQAVARFRTPRARRLGVMPGYPVALPDLPGFEQRCCNPGDSFVGARTLAARLFTIPTHSRLSVEDLSRLRELLCGSGTNNGT